MLGPNHTEKHLISKSIKMRKLLEFSDFGKMRIKGIEIPF